jgi:hypothetical protein
MQLHRGVRRDAWIFCLDYGRLMGDPRALVRASVFPKFPHACALSSSLPQSTFAPEASMTFFHFS